MASLLLRSAAPARRLLTLPLHLAAPAYGPAAPRYCPRDGSSWKYHKMLGSGIHSRTPAAGRAFVHSLKEEAIPTPHQNANTKDDATTQIDSVTIVKDDVAANGMKAAVEMHAEPERINPTQILDSEDSMLDEARPRRPNASMSGGFIIVQEKSAFIVERWGMYQKTLHAGRHRLIPFVDKIAYEHTLKEQIIQIPKHKAVTKDNVSLEVLGTLYIKIIDLYLASYAVGNLISAVETLFQAKLRSELRKITFDEALEEGKSVTETLVRVLNEEEKDWGIQFTRCEIRELKPPLRLKMAMELVTHTEYKKQAMIIEAEGRKQAMIIEAEGRKQAMIIEAEGGKQALIIEAEGEGHRIFSEAKGEAEAIKVLSKAMVVEGSAEASTFKITMDYIEALAKINKSATVILLPDVGSNNVLSLLVVAMKLYERLEASNTVERKVKSEVKGKVKSESTEDPGKTDASSSSSNMLVVPDQESLQGAECPHSEVDEIDERLLWALDKALLLKQRIDSAKQQSSHQPKNESGESINDTGAASQGSTDCGPPPPFSDPGGNGLF